MRKKNYKGRCEKRSLEKFTCVCRTYSDLQYNAANYLSQEKDIESITCNVPLDGDCEDYMSDFVVKKVNGDFAVYECEERRYLTKPRSVELLEKSRMYWLKRGISDFVIITTKEDANDRE